MNWNGQYSHDQCHIMHIISVSELRSLYQLTLKVKEDQMYRRHIEGYEKVTESVQKILRMLFVEGYFIIDEVHEIVENWDENRWFRGLLNARRAQMRLPSEWRRYSFAASSDAGSYALRRSGLSGALFAPSSVSTGVC